MADPQPAESTTDPPTTVTETERVYRIPNSSWNTSPGHLQHPVITDTRYHMPQVSGSAAWGGSTHLPSLLSMEGYSSRTESGLRSSIHSDSYTEAGIESGEDYGSAYHLENFRRLGLGQGISYRVSSTAHSGRHGIVPEDYTKTCTGQESYSRNYISTYSDTRAGLGHESHYRTITGPNDYSRTSIHQDNYTRSQTADEFYLRSNPVGNGFESESGARTDIGRLDSEVPRDKQTPSSLSAVISVSCTGTFTSQVNKLHCGGDGVCYSGRGGTGTQMAITNTDSVSKSSPAVAQGCDPRVRSGSETEHRSSCQGKNAAEFDAGSASAYDSTQSDLSTSSGLEQDQRERPRTEAASQETNHSPRELVTNVQSSGKIVSTSATHKDKTKDLSANQKKEIQHFVISCPGTSFEHVAEHFSKIWDIDITSDIIQQIAKDREKQIIAMQDLSEKMKDAIMSYRKRNQDLSSTDIVSYFTKQWHVTLDEELIERVLNENLLESETGANGCNTNKEDVKENTLHKEDDFKMSKEMKKVISQYKTNHFDMATDEIAEHFSAEWNMKISRETVLNILNEHHDQTPNSSQKFKKSPEHHDNMSTCYLPKDAVVTSGDDLSEEGNYQDGYDNSIAKLVPVTVEEARAGLMKAIAYFMANPSIADGHIRTLWNILHYIDSRDKNTMLPDKDPSSDDENATGHDCSELVDIKQEILEAECSSDAAAESMKSDNFRTSARTASCKMFKARPPANNTYTSIRTKLSNKNRVTSEKTDSTEENDAVRKVINVGDVKVDVDQRLKCPECDDSFSEFTQLLDHITRHSEEKLILAHSCGDRLPLGSNSPVLRPRTRGQGRGRPRCVMGENSSQNAKDKSGVSPKRKRRIKLQNCTLCGRQFNDYSNFRRHLRLHAGLKPHKCPTCGVSFIESNALKKHMRTHTGEKPYLCTTCGKRVTTLAGLQSHARLHTGEKPFKCTVCGKDFAQSSSLKRHMVIHTGERPYGCPQCGKNFPRSEDLKMHIRTHTGLKPYKCLVCGKCFIKSSYLHKHARIHTGEKPYKCTTCGEAFAQSDILAKHIRVHTGERPYCCTVCGKTFTQSGSLYHHMKMHKQHDPSPQKRKTSLVLPEQTEKNVGSVSEPVTNPSQGEHMKFPALTQRLSNSSMVPQMTVFPDSSRHYLSQWRPY